MSTPARVLGTLAFAGRTLEVSLPTLLETLTGRLSVDTVERRLAWWSKKLCEAADVQLTVEGREHLPSRAFVCMSNHESHVDIPILYQALQRPLRMVAKAELFKIPIFGGALRGARFVSVDRRGQREHARASMQEAARILADGISIWIAPEGTRAELDRPVGDLRPFKSGGFRLALETGAPIVPVAILGSRYVLPKHGRMLQRGLPVLVRIGAPIDPVGRTLTELSDSTRATIVRLLAQPLAPDRKAG
jgi:1-acyl-sn-glycerol-3-phosphate acyltransferase